MKQQSKEYWPNPLGDPLDLSDEEVSTYKKEIARVFVDSGLTKKAAIESAERWETSLIDTIVELLELPKSKTYAEFEKKFKSPKTTLNKMAYVKYCYNNDPLVEHYIRTLFDNTGKVPTLGELVNLLEPTFKLMGYRLVRLTYRINGGRNK